MLAHLKKSNKNKRQYVEQCGYKTLIVLWKLSSLEAIKFVTFDCFVEVIKFATFVRCETAVDEKIMVGS